METILTVLRDPITALVVSIVLAILASSVGSCVVRLTFGLGAIAAFIWLLITFEPVEHVVVAVVRVVGTVLVVLLICLALLALVGIFAVVSMNRRETHRESRRTHVPLAPRQRTTVEGDLLNAFLEAHGRLETILSLLRGSGRRRPDQGDRARS